MNKSRAVLTHLWPSALLLLIIGGLIVFAWYPYPFRQLNITTTYLLILIVSAGLIGPALTGLVYRKGKRGLVFDLIVIVIIQFTALASGTVELYQRRPFFMVFTVDRFDVLSMRDVEFDTIDDKRFLDKPISGPILLYANMPEAGPAFQKLIKEIMFEGKPDLQYRPEFWSLYSDKQALALKPSKALNALRIMRPESVSAIDKLVQKHGGNIDNLNFVPALHRYGQFAVVLDADSGQVVDTLMIDPWID